MTVLTITKEVLFPDHVHLFVIIMRADQKHFSLDRISISVLEYTVPPRRQISVIFGSRQWRPSKRRAELNFEYQRDGWWMTHRLVEFGPGLRLNAYSADASGNFIAPASCCWLHTWLQARGAHDR